MKIQRECPFFVSVMVKNLFGKNGSVAAVADVSGRFCISETESRIRIADIYPEAEVMGQFPDRQEETFGPPDQKQEERPKKRGRISMKEKVAEKKAEIAGKDAKSPEPENTKKPPGVEGYTYGL